MTFLRISGKKVALPKANPSIHFEARPGGWIIAHMQDGKRVRFALSQFRDIFGFQIGGRNTHTQWLESQRSVAGVASDSDLTAQFPGKVRKLLLKEGSFVKVGEPLVLIEAMKMEFSIKAPSAGKLLKYLVAEGQQLSPGQLLVEFEAEKNG